MCPILLTVCENSIHGLANVGRCGICHLGFESGKLWDFILNFLQGISYVCAS